MGYTRSRRRSHRTLQEVFARTIGQSKKSGKAGRTGGRDDKGGRYVNLIARMENGILMYAIAKSKPVLNTKTVSLPERCKERSDHTHIVENMQDSRDLAGPVEFCFWSLNGQPCQCGRC